MVLRLALVTVVVRDYDEALDFFVRVLGFGVVEDTGLGDGKRWVVVSPGGGGADVLLARADGQRQLARVGDQTGGRMALFLHTDDLPGDHARWSACGVRFLEEPRTEPYGTVVVFEDISGNRWDLIQPVTSAGR